MASGDVIKNLRQLAKAREVITSFQQDISELEDQAFLNSPDLNGRRHEIFDALKVIEEKGSKLTKMINEAVLEGGESIKGEKLQAVFSNGRTTWDSKALVGYAVAHPEIEKLKKTGKPSVSIREIKGV